MAEVTTDGFVGKTENEYFVELQDLFLAIDSSWNLDPSTPDGLKIAADAETFVILDEAARHAYNSKDPNRARGVELDILSALTGTVRNLGTPSNVDVALTGVSGTIIIAGKTIEDPSTGTQWTTDNTVTITGGGTVNTTATCTVNGATEANTGAITRIVDTVGGWQSVTNISTPVLGTDVQSDASLRAERRDAVAKPGSNQIDNTAGEIYAVDGVRAVRIYENTLSVPDSEGRDPHSQTIFVDGGGDDEIATAIYVKKNPGSALYAAPLATAVTVNVTSPVYSWNSQDITFNRADPVNITVLVEITDDGTLPGNAATLVTEAIIEYSQGILTDPSCGFRSSPYQIGEDVTFSSLYTPVNHVIGQYGNSYISSLVLNGGGSNVVVDWYQLSLWSSANITVNVV